MSKSSQAGAQRCDLSVVYVSEALQPFDGPGLSTLADQAAQRNLAMDVTGYLYHANDRFVQYLEGPAEPLRGLLDRIREDARHRFLAVFWEEQLESRRFPHWRMRWLKEFETRQIGLEDLLMDHLIFSSQAELQAPSIDDTIRRMVTAIASRRLQLA